MPTPLQQLIIERIQGQGPITFAEYMRMALYEPSHGYYVSGRTRVGWEGDFYTSTDVSTFFANCMGRQLQAMWEYLNHPSPFVVLEQGAGREHLAEGVRAWAEQEATDLHAALDYQTADIHMGLDALYPMGVKRMRGEFQRGDIVAGPAGHPQGPIPASSTPRAPTDADAGGKGREHPQGSISASSTPRAPTDSVLHPDALKPHVILSNELVDAFPVHIVQTQQSRLYEVYVDVREGQLCEVLAEPSSPEVAGYLERYKIPWTTFGDGWRAEINLDALHWMETTARLLLGTGTRKRRGFLLAIDYGDKARELYTPYRRHGTLACYYQHQITERPLVRPGEQDITAHVNFSALIDEGRRQGLRLHTLTTQRAWLTSMGIYEEMARVRERDFALIDSQRASDQGQVALLQWYNLSQRIAALTEPTGMGNFKVLILKR